MILISVPDLYRHVIEVGCIDDFHLHRNRLPFRGIKPLIADLQNLVKIIQRLRMGFAVHGKLNGQREMTGFERLAVAVESANRQFEIITRTLKTRTACCRCKPDGTVVGQNQNRQRFGVGTSRNVGFGQQQ